MNIIIKNDNFYIGQDQSDNKSFTIFFDSYNEALIKSILKTRIILGATTTEKYRSLTFKASSVLSFFDFQKTRQISWRVFTELLRRGGRTSASGTEISHNARAWCEVAGSPASAGLTDISHKQLLCEVLRSEAEQHGAERLLPSACVMQNTRLAER